MTAAQPRRRMLAGTALTMLVLAAAAGCGGSNSRTTPDASVPPAQSLQELQAAAEREGSVVWYTTVSSDDVQPLIEAFNKDYPKIKVDPIRMSADQMPARVLTEQRGGKFNADVISGDSTQTSQFIGVGALQPYDPPELPPLPAGLNMPAGFRGVIYTVTTVIAYNPTVLKANNVAPPTSWQDLTKPEWKGHFSVDPGEVNWYDSMVSSMGHDAALALMQALGRNSPRLVESHTQALVQVQSGEPWATATAYGYAASKLKKKAPQQVEFVNSSPLPTGLTLIAAAAKPPHPNAAKLFLGWMQSKAGQQAVVTVTNHTSLRDDVGNDPDVWDPAKWKPAWASANISQEQYNKLLEEYKKALGAP
jgi:iron(III) transport system substrate-binding protein